MALTRRQFVVAAALACIGCAEQQSNKTAATGANMQTGMSSKQALFKSIDKNGNLVGRNEPEIGKQNLICPNWGGGRSWNPRNLADGPN